MQSFGLCYPQHVKKQHFGSYQAQSVIFYFFLQSYEKKISNKEQAFISLFGPSGSGKRHLIFEWLNIGVLNQHLTKLFIFININNLLMFKCKEKTLNVSKE